MTLWDLLWIAPCLALGLLLVGAVVVSWLVLRATKPESYEEW